MSRITGALSLASSCELSQVRAVVLGLGFDLVQLADQRDEPCGRLVWSALVLGAGLQSIVKVASANSTKAL